MTLAQSIIRSELYNALMQYTTDYAVSRGKSYEKARQFALIRQHHIDDEVKHGIPTDEWIWTPCKWDRTSSHSSNSSNSSLPI